MRIVVCTPTRNAIPAVAAASILRARLKYFDATGSMPAHLVVPGADENDSPVENRLRLLAWARREGATHIWWVDDDTVVPDDALVKLAAHNAPLVTGVVFRKLDDDENHACIGWRRERLGGIPEYSDCWQWPDYFEVDVCGFGCFLTAMEVFDSIEGAGRPAFQWNWFLQVKQGDGFVNSLVTKGEDVWFCIEARKRGYRIYCDSSVRCGHLDAETGRVYPSAAKWAEFRRGARKVFVFSEPRDRERIRGAAHASA